MEKYRDIQEYKGLYRVSSMGNVLSLARKTPGRWGKTKTSPGRVLKGSIINSGYKRVDLSKNGKVTHHFVHRLVASAFMDNIENKPCVNHIDSNRLNNNADNLEWCTYKENTNHGVVKGNITFPNYKRDTTNLTFNGKTMTLQEWSRELNIKYSTLYARVAYKGWSDEKALTYVRFQRSRATSLLKALKETS